MPDLASHPVMEGHSGPIVFKSPGNAEAEIQELLAAQRYLRSRGVASEAAGLGPWEPFYRRYDPKIQRMVRAWRLTPADVDDCVQEVWAELVAKLAEFQFDPARGPFKAWLATVVRRKVIGYLRRRGRDVCVPLADEPSLPARGPSDPVATAERRERRRLVRRGLSALRRRVSAENYRIMRLRWIEGRSTRQVADELRISEPQVRYRLHRMKGKLRSLLERPALGGELADGR